MKSNFPPKLHPLISDYLESEGETIHETVENFGSPTHIVFPQLIAENVNKFRAALSKYGFDESVIHFAAKVNKSESLLEEVANLEIGADVSSLEELRAALAHGITGERISVSGPSKNPRLLALAIHQGSIISIDSLYELEALLGLMDGLKAQKAKPRILIRLNGLSKAHSRFGVSVTELPALLSKLSPENGALDFQGFHFHLSGYSAEERTAALKTAIRELQKARSLGYKCNTINMGGGFAVQYIDTEDWQRFLMQRTPQHFLASKAIESFYPYGAEQDGGQQLASILAAQSDTHANIAALLKEQDIRLAIEPGRSLVDQAGLTCIQIKGVKPTSDGTLVLEVDANINHLSEQWFGSEYCVDPIHLQKSPTSDASPIQVAIAGNTCLEIDMLSWRKIGFARTPKTGDILVYANTAGYQMDSNESSFHRLAIPEKLAAFKKGGKWRQKKDSEYSFLDAKYA